jgi:hypothetical protein
METMVPNKGRRPGTRGSKMSKGAWIVNKPAVVSEVIDGELVVMNLATGNYFSSAGSGALLWSQLDAGASEEALATTLCSRLDVDAATASGDVARFVAQLLAESLVREVDPATVAAAHPVAAAVREPYAAPRMDVYSDMRDLLMLDPIHDVAEDGWPSRPPEMKQAG